MELIKTFLFKIIAPMTWLVFFAYAFAISGKNLAKAWKVQNTRQIVFYLWIILVGFYFLIYGGG